MDLPNESMRDSRLMRSESQQPMSLMTIDKNAHRRKPISSEDLLTIRIIEASERKMQLIRTLLSPEQFKSIAPDLFGTELDDSINPENQVQAARSPLVSSVPAYPVAERLIEFEKKNLSLSDTNLGHTSTNLQENLARKRKAIEFFFQEPEGTALKHVDLAIELRSGHYLNSSEEEDKLKLKKKVFNLRDRVIGLLSFVGVTFTEESAGTGEGKKFLEFYRKLKRQPYNRDQNLIVMKDRLEADGQLGKISGTLVEDGGAENFCHSSTHLDLAQMYKDHVVSSRSSEHLKQIKVVQPVGHFNAIHLVGPKEYDFTKGTSLLISPQLDCEHRLNATLNLSGLPPESLENRLVQTEFDKLVDSLYRSAFTFCHPAYNTELKLFRLMNRLDIGFSTQSSLAGESSKPYFILDPFLEYFAPGKPNKEVASDNWQVRRSLLVWRFINNLNQLVHLNERDNLKDYGSQVEELRTRMQPLNLGPESGFRFVAQIRSFAVEYVKSYESQLKELLDLNIKRSVVVRSSRLCDLLKEPQLEMMDLSGVIKFVNGLVPKPSARRPLMPNRKEATLAMSQDLEASVVGKLNFVNRTSHRLVVTIQQAYNLPMRVLPQQPIQINRPNSPFYSPSPTSFTQAKALSLKNKLAPPTSYVEVVFQRKQYASSLSFGRNPTWNETIFLSMETPVADPITLSTDADPTYSRLANEFLQLNLFDYHCYTQDDSGTNSRQDNYEPNTLALASNMIETVVQVHSVVASRQRIERHLLGSLRVPLTTLLTNGKIEGSFALNQPLFLDNYQFESDEAFGTSDTSVRRNPLETYVNLFITLDPPVVIPSQTYLPVGSLENDQIFEYAKLWEQITSLHKHNVPVGAQVRNMTGHSSRKHTLIGQKRHVKALVLNRNGRYCLTSRLLRPMSPPAGLSNPRVIGITNQMKALARFVSLLSPLKYGLFAMRLLASSIWFDSEQLLNKNLGGPEEKAVLLCNYFLHQGKCSAVLLGDMIPQGRCFHVIVWNEQTHFIENQLQQQASNLLESLKGLPGDAQPMESTRRQPVNHDNFIARLPIFIGAKSILLWNPINGESYSLSDPHQLTSVGSIITTENIYANIQSSDNPSQTNFDIRLRHFWLPLFETSAQTSTTPTPTISFKDRKTDKMNWRHQITRLENIRKTLGRPTIVPMTTKSSLEYRKFNESQCEELKSSIERAIKAHLLKWRPDRPTYFNRTVSRLLADKLVLFESYLDGSGDRKADWKVELADLIKNEVLMAHLSSRNRRKVVSWPVNMPYTSMKGILDSLFASGVQDADLVLDPDLQSASSTQFLVACHVYPYPAYVLSVWLYVAAVVQCV